MAPPSVLITGCSEGGIGSALATCFAARGLVVFATARNVQRMAHLANTPNIHLLELDVSNPNQVRDVAEQISRQINGTLDYLVNNAGQTRFTPLLDENLEQVKELFDINVYGALRLTQACAEMLVKASGKVVFVSSVSGYVNVPWQGKVASISTYHAKEIILTEHG
jgi:1-acylglycerone phosphate reductase